jgi:hypothetical protein
MGTHTPYNQLAYVSWTKVDQTDFYALCVIDPQLAEAVKEIAIKEGKPFREVLRSAVRQRQFRATSGLKKFWEKLSPDERRVQARKSSAIAWKKTKPSTDPDEGERK